MEKEPLRLGTDGELSLFTGWVSENSLDKLKLQVEEIRTNFLAFLQTIEPEIKGIHTIYDELDAEEGVEKWLVKFSPRYQSGFTEEVKY